MRVVEHAAVERVLLDRRLPAHDPGDEPGHRVDHGHSGYFSSGQHKIPKRDLPVDILRDKSLVQPLVPAAYEHDMPLRREGLHYLLGEQVPLGRRADHTAALAVIPLGLGQGALQDLGHEHHAATAAEAVVVYLAIPAQPVFSQVDDVHAEKASVYGPADHARGQKPVEKIRERRDQAYAHVYHSPSTREILTCSFSRFTSAIN
ncbi:MAG: hypothetical protein BWY99_01055 [Synergistetes bacterium ADurb.BinA166]|nr:MAG: hypothetical protein BWY99_01055 [Synergistetes bacterium ADurb.BinA166]